MTTAAEPSSEPSTDRAGPVEASRIGRWIYRLLPIRRRTVLANLRRVFGERLEEPEIERLAQAFYGHLGRAALEFACFPFLSPEKRRSRVRLENVDAVRRAGAKGRGILILAAHLGNWEVASVAAFSSFPEYRGRFHVLRRPLRPAWLDALVARRFHAAGIRVLSKTGALGETLARLAENDAIIFVFDQHAAGRDGVRVDFLGSPAWTFKSLALLALRSGAAVVPVATFRAPDGCHVVRFSEALPPPAAADSPAEAVRHATQGYNDALARIILEHPEQWFWMHRRWKELR